MCRDGVCYKIGDAYFGEMLSHPGVVLDGQIIAVASPELPTI